MLKTKANHSFARAGGRVRHKRSRRGMAMVETTLSLFVVAAVAGGVIEFIANDRLDELNQSSAREVSLVADAAEAFALVNFDSVNAQIAAEADGIIEVAPSVLRSAGFLDTDEPITPFKDPITVLYISDDPGVITAFAVARRSLTRDNSYTVPRPEPGIRAVGVNPRFRGATVIGYGLEFRIHNGRRSLVTDAGVANGSLVGVRTVSFANDISPYLHRIAIPGRPELNTMAVDIDMAGHSITGVDEVQSQSLNTSTLNVANAVTATSAAINGTLTVNGDADISGSVTGGAATFSRRLDAGELQVTGEARASSLVAQAVTATSASFSQSLSTTTLDAGVSTVGALTANSLSASNVTIQEVTADTIILNGSLTADEGFINQITTGGCTGC